jgi:hypothetical protein
MATQLKTDGQCVTCGSIVSKQNAWKHISSCVVANNDTGLKEKNSFLMRVFDESGLFWIYISVPIDSTLSDLDWYVRRLWLECCGHMSRFEIDGVSYMVIPQAGDRSMDVRADTVLKVGSKAAYEYDFGTSTHLSFEVVQEYAAKKADDIVLLMRNEMPKAGCQVCGKTPTLICCFCHQLSCKKCKKKDACKEEDSLLPFVNSPRTGECGYTGD